MDNQQSSPNSQTPKINKEFIMTNLIAILSGVSIISLAMPFMTWTSESVVTVLGAGGSISRDGGTLTGISMIGGSFWGIMLLAIPALLIAMNYIKQIAPYKKYIVLGAPVLCLINLFLFLPRMITSGSMSQNVTGFMTMGSARVTFTSSLSLGAWIMAICMVLVMALGIIQFFKLKTNIAIIDEVASKSKTFE